ncbi:bifunctional hydroxyacyl-CoA dehydrogenase/enoyl-CoA hydratase fox2, partial [Ascosphaera pollenicola]
PPPSSENRLKKSHTSLLIEYFESSKRGPNGAASRPTVRVSPSRGGTLTASTNASASASGSQPRPLSSSAAATRPTSARQQSQQNRYPLHRTPIRQSDSRTSSSATSSSEEVIDPVAAREGKRAAVPVTSSVSYQPASSSAAARPGSGSAASASAAPPQAKYQYRQRGGSQPRQSSQPRTPAHARQSSHARSNSQSKSQSQPKQPQSHSNAYAQQHGKGGYAKFDASYTTDDDRRASTDLDDPRFSAPTPSDLSSMPSDSLLNGEHEDLMSGGNGKRREKLHEMSYAYSDDSTSSSDEEAAGDADDDHDHDDESITVSGGGDPNHKLGAGLAGRVIHGATEKVNRERREKRGSGRHPSPWRKRGAEPSPQVPLGGIASLSSAVSSTYPNAQSLPTTSATSSLQTNLHPNHNIHNQPGAGQNYISLDAVEDVIRRLILPELAELKNNQRVQANRGLFEQKIAQSSRLSGVSESVKEEALRKLLAKHRSAPDVILSTKLAPERQREVSGGSTVKAGQQGNNAKPGGSTGAADAAAHARPSSRTGIGLGPPMQVPRIVVPDSVSPTPEDEGDDLMGQQQRRWRRRKNDHRPYSGGFRNVKEGGEDEDSREHEADEDEKGKGREMETRRPTSRANSRYSMRSENSFDSMISGSTEMAGAVPRRKSKSLREAENKGLVSSKLKNFNRGGPASETIDEGDSKNLVPEGVKTELVFRRAGVPDMPFKSAVGSDITRSSILSDRSDDDDDDEEEDDYDDEEDDEKMARRREEARQGKRPAFHVEHHAPSPSLQDSRPRSLSPIKRKPLPSAELTTTTPRNISDQSNSTFAPGLSSHIDSSRLTTAFTDPSTSHLPSATASEFPSTLAPASSRNIDSILGLATGTGSGSQDVHPPTIFTGLTTDESHITSSHHLSSRSIDNDIIEATGRHVEHTNAEH